MDIVWEIITVVENEGIMITSDYNFIDVDFFVEYRILEPVKYLYNSEEPEEYSKKYFSKLYPYSNRKL
mgnify:CR=1 FL=1